MFDHPTSVLYCAGLSFVLLGSFVTSLVPPVAAQADHSPRQIVGQSRHFDWRGDRFFDLSVGSDYPGTLIRDDSQAQLKLAVDELGSATFASPTIFHDVLGNVRTEDGKTSMTGQRSNQLYDGLQGPP